MGGAVTMAGYYLMARGWLDHAALAVGPYDRRAAWAWLVENAAYKPTRRNIGGRTIELQRGQLTASVRYLAQAWSWKKNVVERFIDRLKTETMIRTEAGTGQLVITICNYDKYQIEPGESRTPNRTLDRTETGQQPDSDRTNKNEGNEGKEGNKENPVLRTDAAASAPPPSGSLFDLKAEVFRRGKIFLSAAGIAEKQAGALLGKWRRDHGDAAVLDALSRTEREGASEPIAFVEGILRAQSRGSGRGSRGRVTVAEACRRIEEFGDE